MRITLGVSTAYSGLRTSVLMLAFSGALGGAHAQQVVSYRNILGNSDIIFYYRGFRIHNTLISPSNTSPLTQKSSGRLLITKYYFHLPCK